MSLNYTNYYEPKKIMLMTCNPRVINETLRYHKERIQYALDFMMRIYPNRANLDTGLLRDVNEYVKVAIGLDIPVATLAQMFVLFPYEASLVIDIATTEARDAALDLISRFYLNSRYPSVDDCIDDEEWAEALRLGYDYMHKGQTA